MTVSFVRIAIAAAMVSLAACGGGGAGTGSSSIPSATPTKAAAQTVAVTFTITIPRATSSTSRHLQYISASTASASVSVNAGAPVTAACSTTCTLTINAPVGLDTFNASLYDASHVLLSQGSTSATIGATIANVVAIAFGGQVAKIQLASAVTHLVPGTLATTATVSVTVLDADNNTIVGTDPYANPITLSNSDASGNTTVSTISITSPAVSSVTFTYNGSGTLAGNTVTITPSATGAGTITPASFSVYPHHTILEYPIPGGIYPDSVATGSDGNLWFGQQNVAAIGYVTPDGTVQQFSTSGGIAFICEGPDGNIWFTEFSTNKIGRVTPAGAVTEFNVLTANAQPEGIASGSSGNLYFAEFGASNPGRLGQITTAGTVTESAQIPSTPQLEGVAMGADGRMWVTEPFSSSPMLDAFSQTTLAYTQYSIPGGAQLRNVVSGPLSLLWIIDAANAKLDLVNTSGTFINQLSLADPNPEGLAVGSDGKLYYGGTHTNIIGSVTTAGVETDYTIPTAGANPADLTTGPDGNIWFAEFLTNKIGRLIL